jgi:hypothetical protein
MKSIAVRSLVVCLAVSSLWAQTASRQNGTSNSTASSKISSAVDKGARWLVSVQSTDGGWGQDGGETSYIRTGQRVETNGNDVANTAVAALALLQAGKQYQPNVERALTFILQKVEASPVDGLAITNLEGTQIQRKLGPYIDTFLTSMLLAQVDGTLSKPALNARVRKALEKSIAKIQKNQKSDGSWNLAGGWAPVLGTSMASRSLYEAQRKGVAVDAVAMEKASEYSVRAFSASVGTGRGAGVGAGGAAPAARPEAAGIGLYQSAQALEQLSRTDGDRKQNASQIATIVNQLKDERFVEGFGSIGGEEFFSYLNVSDGLKRSGGTAWKDWHAQITQKILNLQNNDGTWAGHHCITGRVAVTSAAMLNLTVDRAN